MRFPLLEIACEKTFADTPIEGFESSFLFGSRKGVSVFDGLVAFGCTASIECYVCAGKMRDASVCEHMVACLSLEAFVYDMIDGGVVSR